MVRNSVLYHRLLYVRKRNTRRFHVLIRIFVIIMVFALLMFFIRNCAIPYVLNISESTLQPVVTSLVNESVTSQLKENVTYGSLVTQTTDQSGKITSIQFNSFKIRQLSQEISKGAEDKLSTLENCSIQVPMGVLLASSVFSDTGPKIRVHLMPLGNVETSFKNEFAEDGPNKMIHRIFVEVKTHVKMTAPLSKRTIEEITRIQIAECIFINNIPEFE